MSDSLKHLALRMRNELPEIEHTLKRAIEGVKRAKQAMDNFFWKLTRGKKLERTQRLGDPHEPNKKCPKRITSLLRQWPGRR